MWSQELKKLEQRVSKKNTDRTDYFILGDYHLFKEIIRNMLSNVKHSFEKIDTKDYAKEVSLHIDLNVKINIDDELAKDGLQIQVISKGKQ